MLAIVCLCFFFIYKLNKAKVWWGRKATRREEAGGVVSFPRNLVDLREIIFHKRSPGSNQNNFWSGWPIVLSGCDSFVVFVPFGAQLLSVDIRCTSVHEQTFIYFIPLSLLFQGNTSYTHVHTTPSRSGCCIIQHCTPSKTESCISSQYLITLSYVS